MAEASAQPAHPTNRRGVSWFLFVGFIVITLSLILLTWRENLTDEAASIPGYYRDTFVIDESVYATVTAEAAAAEQAVTPVP